MTRENQEILKRINMRKPEYSVQQWARDWEENQQFMDNISAFPKDWWLEEVGVQSQRLSALCCGRCRPDHQDFIIWCVITRFALSGVSVPGFHHLGGCHHQVFIIWCVITRFALPGMSSPGLHCLECHHLVFIIGVGGWGVGFCYLSAVIRFSSSWMPSPGFYNLGYRHQVFIITGAITRFYNLGHHHQVFIT